MISWIFRCEKYVEKKKDFGWKLLNSQKMAFYFELIPKYQEKREIFLCETEENQNVKKLNKNQI